MSRIYFFLLIFLITAGFSQSNIRLTGMVYDAQTGALLDNALIELIASGYGAYSDLSGRYTIENIPPGEYQVNCRMQGYHDSDAIGVRIREKFTVVLDFYLTQEISYGGVIVAEAERSDYPHVQGTTFIFPESWLNQNRHRSLDAILKETGWLQLEKAAGGSDFRIRIHGSSANQVLVLLDGQKLNNAGGGSVNLADIPVAEIERIEISRQGDAARDGVNALAGTISLVTRKPESNSALSLSGGIGSFSTTDLTGAGNTVLGNWHFAVRAGYRYSRQDFPYQYEGIDFVRENAAYRFENYFSRINWIDGSHEFSAVIRHREGERGLPSAYFNEQPVYKGENGEVEQHISLQYTEKLSPEWRVEAAVSRSRLQQWYDNSFDPSPYTRYHLRNDNQTQQARLRFNGRLTDWLQTESGFEYNRESIGLKNFLYPQYDLTAVSREAKSVFARLESGLDSYGMPVSAWLAGRASRYFDRKVDWLPSLGMAARIPGAEYIKLTTAWSRGIRYPDFNSLFWKSSAQAQGNPALLPEQSETISASVRYEAGSEWSPVLEVYGYRERINNLIYWEMIRNAWWQPRNMQKVQREGIDFSMQQTLFPGIASVRAGYSLIDTRNKTADPNMYDKRLVFVAEKTFTVSANARYAGVTLDVYYRSESERETVKANSLGTQLPAYETWDASLSYDGLFKQILYRFILSGENLSDTQYQLIRGFPMPGRSLRFESEIKYQIN